MLLFGIEKYIYLEVNCNGIMTSAVLFVQPEIYELFRLLLRYVLFDTHL